MKTANSTKKTNSLLHLRLVTMLLLVTFASAGCCPLAIGCHPMPEMYRLKVPKELMEPPRNAELAVRLRASQQIVPSTPSK